MTATSETKLFAHILVLALHLDNFSVVPQQLAQELSVPTQRYVCFFWLTGRVSELLRSLGCSSSQSTQHGVEDGNVVSQQVKQWRLKIPLSFPQQRKRGPARR